MQVLQIITNAAGIILSQPLPPIPQRTGPDFGAFLINALFAIIWAIVAALIFTIIVSVGMRLYRVLTPGFDELRELAEGNMAVGITMASFILGLAAVVIAVLSK